MILIEIGPGTFVSNNSKKRHSLGEIERFNAYLWCGRNPEETSV